MTEQANNTIQAQNQISLQLLRPYEDALRLANPGIDQMQARTMVYWGIGTYYDFEPKPLLLILSSFGCGKTDLLTALFPMVKEGKWIEGNSYAVIRNELHHCETAFIDEKERIPESLLVKRFRKANSRIAINQAVEGVVFTRRELDINGWTVVAARKPFYDVALMSRSLIISPRFIENPDARVTDAGNLRPIADQLGQVHQLPSEGRAIQVWRPLAAIAGRFNDQEWLNYAMNTFVSDMEEQGLNRQFEPEQAITNALEICKNSAEKLHDHWIKLSDIKKTANAEYDANLKTQQVMTTLHRRGLDISTIDGYQAVRVV
jgi:hypothetical protein